MTAFTQESLVTKLGDHPHEIIHLNDNGSSWIIHAKRFATVDSFDDYWNLHPVTKRCVVMWGKPVALPRFVENYGVDYEFTGAMFRGQQMPEVMRSAAEKLQALVVNKAGKTMFNNCLTNWYETGEHYIGPHSDNEMELYSGSPILTLSLGATRKFRLAPKPGTSGNSVTIDVQDGDLLIMGGTTQKTHLHSVPKTKRCKERRISITMRCKRV